MLTSTVLKKNSRIDGQRFEAFFQEHYAMVFRAAYSVTHSRQDAEDAVQTVFMNVLRRDNHKQLAANVAGYLYRAAINEALHIVRSRARQKVVSDLESVERISERSGSMVEAEMREILKQCDDETETGTCRDSHPSI